MNRFVSVGIFALLSMLLNGCQHHEEDAAPTSFRVYSAGVDENGRLATTYTCDGDSINPPLRWQGAPKGTQYFAVLMDHAAPEGPHWYWTLYNISPSTHYIAPGSNAGTVGSNSINHLAQYAPPCSKGPGEKDYIVHVYALSEPLVFDKNAEVDAEALLNAMKGHVLDAATVTLRYSRDPSNHGPAAFRPHREDPRCGQIKQSVDDAGFADKVTVTCDDTYAYIESDTYPDHDLMNGITGTNEQIPVPARGYRAPIKLHSEKADAITTIDASLGVAVNGVPIYDYSTQGDVSPEQYDASHDTVLLGQLDNCGGHAGRGDDYHYHAKPTCMINGMANRGDDSIIGWAYDGYPIYQDNNPDGSPIAKGELDVCNGKADSLYGYRYHTSNYPPYILQCLVGKVDRAVLPRVAPLSSDNAQIRADLRPPTGGVENLTHQVEKDGTRVMAYDYQGEHYYTRYTPIAEKSGCYLFEQKTVSNGGLTESGTFCREEGRQPAPKKRPPRRENHRQPYVVHTDERHQGSHQFKLDVWADNWFSAFLGEELLLEDSVSIYTERSFNAESIVFHSDFPLNMNFIIKDFKENDTGLEYIGQPNQQMGDGGFIMQITDMDSGKVVAVSDANMRCKVLHKAPLNSACVSETSPVAGEGPCQFISSPPPEGWLSVEFDASAWPHAVEHSQDAVGPKDGFNEIRWASKARFIWGDDLKKDNTLACKLVVNGPQ